MLRHYLLDGHTPYEVPCDTSAGAFLKWAQAFEECDRQVAFDRLPLATVSTVFLGIDMSWFGGPPKLFETMVFVHPELKELPMDGFQIRTSTWEQAEAAHAEVMAEILKAHQEAAG